MDKTEKILVLGGGRHQINLIQYLEDNGFEVVLSDYLPESPGHKVASHPTLTSTLDFEANLELAKEHNIKGVITSGTDQPLNIMAKIGEALDVSSYLSVKSAALCTDKRKMFEVLSAKGLNIPMYKIVHSADEIPSSLKYPIIIKPVDSQGQRGISIVEEAGNLRDEVEGAIAESKSKAAIVQEFVKGPEITISAWVSNAKAQVLLITDRVTYNKDEAVGVCFQHVYPSSAIEGLSDKAAALAQSIAEAYELHSGPIYIQCIVQEGEIHIVEATCRIGGGHEDQLIKQITGIDIYPHLLELASTGKSDNFPEVGSFPLDGKFALINFLLAREGKLNELIIPEHEENFMQGNYYYNKGYLQKKIVNSLGRVGYFMADGNSFSALHENANRIYNAFSAKDNAESNELIFWPEESYVNA